MNGFSFESNARVPRSETCARVAIRIVQSECKGRKKSKNTINNPGYLCRRKENVYEESKSHRREKKILMKKNSPVTILWRSNVSRLARMRNYVRKKTAGNLTLPDKE